MCMAIPLVRKFSFVDTQISLKAFSPKPEGSLLHTADVLVVIAVIIGGDPLFEEYLVSTASTLSDSSLGFWTELWSNREGRSGDFIDQAVLN